MALDHYVSQVHLRKFCSPPPEQYLHAIQKSTLKQFRTNTRAVCRIEEGSTNRFLTNPRSVERFLKNIEPKYDAALDSFRGDSVHAEAIYVFAGFAAYVATCSPTAMRLHTESLKATIHSTASVMHAAGRFGPSPPELGGRSLPELLADGTVVAKVNQKFPQAIGMTNILKIASTFGNSNWDLLENDSEIPFLTSDFPLAVRGSAQAGNLAHLLPLAPDFAVCIHPVRNPENTKVDLDFPRFRCRRSRLSTAEARDFNQQIVRSAENFVFGNGNSEEVTRLVEENRRYRLENVISILPAARGLLNVSTLTVVESKSMVSESKGGDSGDTILI